MTENQKLRDAFELGWKMAANWSLSDHLLADMESPAYLTERDGLLQALATTEPAVNQQLTTEPVDERGAFEKWLGIKPCGAAHDFGWAAWQARAAMTHGVKG